MLDDDQFQELSEFEERPASVLPVLIWEWLRLVAFFLTGMYGIDWVWDSFLHWAFPV